MPNYPRIAQENMSSAKTSNFICQPLKVDFERPAHSRRSAEKIFAKLAQKATRNPANLSPRIRALLRDIGRCVATHVINKKRNVSLFKPNGNQPLCTHRPWVPRHPVPRPLAPDVLASARRPSSSRRQTRCARGTALTTPSPLQGTGTEFEKSQHASINTV
jgi:hypothetical protein